MKKITEKELQALIDETIDEVIEELTATGDVAGYDAPMAPPQRRKLHKYENDLE